MVDDGMYKVPERYDFFPSMADAKAENSDFQDILNITDSAAWDVLNEMYDNRFSLEHDWTCVIALGTRADQDTCEQPYAPDVYPVQHWLSRDLYYRLFRKPTDVTIRIVKGVGADAEISNEFRTYEEDIAAFTTGKQKDAGGQFEWITDDITGMRFGYLYEPFNVKENKGVMTHGGRKQITYSAIVYEHMTYSRYSSSWTEFSEKWSEIAPSCGITVPKHQQRFRILVELPTNANIIPADWRQYITFLHGEKQPIRFKSMLPNGQRISDLVKANMPQWMKDILQQLDTPITVGDKLQAELDKTLKELLANRKANIGGYNHGSRANVSRRAKHAVGTFPPSMSAPRNKPTVPRGSSGNLPRTPTIPIFRFCNDVNEWNEMGGSYTNIIHNKAAWYDLDNQQVWLNGKYPVLETQVAEILQKLPCDHEDYHGQVQTIVHEDASARVGQFIIHFIAKTVERGGWDNDMIEQSYTPMALTPGAVDIFYNKESVLKLAAKAKKTLDNKVH
jgi:hypothetical protein